MARDPKDEIDQFILDNHEKYTDERLVEKLNELGLTIGVEALRKRRRAMGIQKATNSGSQYYKAQIERLGIKDTDWKMAWDKSDGLSVLVHNPLFKKDSFLEFKEKAIEEMQRYSPKYPTIKRTEVKDAHCLVVNITDVHIGENTELSIARCQDALADIVHKSSLFLIDRVIFVGGNDVIHVDTMHHTTTKGTQLHAQISPQEIFTKAKTLYISLIEQLAAIADVHYIHVPDNHAELSGFHLSDVVASWFRNAKNITFDTSAQYRKCYVYGDNLLAFAHGHGVKDNERPLDIATAFPKEWGSTQHRYCYLGHVHHNKSIISKNIKEMNGIEVQWLRSTQPRNEYESLSGYHSKAGVSTFIHHPTKGQVARFNVNF